MLTVIIYVFFTAAFADEGVWIYNKTNEKIWVVLEAKKRLLTESETRNNSEIDFESYVEMVLQQKVESPIAGQATMGEAEAKMHLRNHWDNNKKLKFQYSDFIQPGESQLEPQTKRKLQKPAATYYFTYRTNKKIKENRVATKNDKIVITASGTDAIPLDGTRVVSGTKMEFYNPKSKKGFGFPEDSKEWDAGTYRKSRAAHVLEKVDFDNSRCPHKPDICDGDTVRIKSHDVTYKDQSYLYCYNDGSMYYDTKQKSKKSQIWIVSKQSSDDDDDYVRSGDKIILSNTKYRQTSIGIYDDKWLQCMNEEIEWKIKAVK